MRKNRRSHIGPSAIVLHSFFLFLRCCVNTMQLSCIFVAHLTLIGYMIFALDLHEVYLAKNCYRFPHCSFFSWIYRAGATVVLAVLVYALHAFLINNQVICLRSRVQRFLWNFVKPLQGEGERTPICDLYQWTLKDLNLCLSKRTLQLQLFREKAPVIFHKQRVLRPLSAGRPITRHYGFPAFTYTVWIVKPHPDTILQKSQKKVSDARLFL